MRVHALLHVPFEGLAALEPWLNRHEHVITRSRLWEGDVLPDEDSFDWVIVMGGPMGVHDEADYPWLKPEKFFIERAISKGKRVLGICLGSQLIAHVLGARVFRNRHKEIGWFPISVTQEETNPSWLQSTDEHHFFHWHGDTFDLPTGSMHLAGTDACENQAFSLGSNVLALQFHPEATGESIRQIIAHGSSDLTPGPYVQSPDDMLSRKDHLVQLQRDLSVILERFSSEIP